MVALTVQGTRWYTRQTDLQHKYSALRHICVKLKNWIIHQQVGELHQQDMVMPSYGAENICNLIMTLLPGIATGVYDASIAC